MIFDAATNEQVEAVIQALPVALDQNIAIFGNKEKVFYVLPTSAFLAFAATTQYARVTPERQHALLVNGLDVFRKALRGREIANRYSKGWRCMSNDQEIAPFAHMALEVAKKGIDETNLMPARTAEREKLIHRTLFEFCAIASCLEPIEMGGMMSMANEVVAGILKCGWLDRNVIKIGG